MKWKRKTQERLGNYWFGGASYMTKGVQESLTTEEILSIIVELKLAVKLYQGIDYLQVLNGFYKGVNGLSKQCYTDLLFLLPYILMCN